MNGIACGPVEEPLKTTHHEVYGKMSRKEYMEAIFGPTLNIENLTFFDKMKKILTSHYLHIVIIALVLIDSLCVTVELVISLEENGEENEALHHTENVFKYLGLSILTFFMFELVLKIIFINWDILKSKLEVFDAVIVLVSFTMEIVFLHKKSSIEAIGGILALFRFWRIVRIVNGIIMTVEKRAESKIEKIKASLNAVLKETQNVTNELRKKQELLNDIKVAYNF